MTADDRCRIKNQMTQLMPICKTTQPDTNKKAVFPKKYGFLNITINSDYSSEPV